LQSGQVAAAAPLSLRAAGAPQLAQNALPSKVSAKHEGQLTVASRARQ